MTYSVFLLVFLLIPICGLLIFLRKQLRRHHSLGLLLVNLLAFVYTTPWDNFAAYKKLWTFAPEFVWGPPLWFGFLPLEEYLFYFAEATLVCLTLIALGQIPALRPDTEESIGKKDERDGEGRDAVR